jgi:hypothetical protein
VLLQGCVGLELDLPPRVVHQELHLDAPVVADHLPLRESSCDLRRAGLSMSNQLVLQMAIKIVLLFWAALKSLIKQS